MQSVATALLLLSYKLVAAAPWPYDRYHAELRPSGQYHAVKSKPEFAQPPSNHFVTWLGDLSRSDQNDIDFRPFFENGTIPSTVHFHELPNLLNVPPPSNRTNASSSPSRPSWAGQDPAELFSHLPFPLDPRCLGDKSKWWYRVVGGSCNWLEAGHVDQGEFAQPKSRDYGQHYYADGISKPREGPNARAVSNAFFKRKKALYYEHTPLLLGLVEFIMHDITWSQDSASEYIEVPMPEDEATFPKNTTLRVHRTEAFPGTGTSEQNPRENVNRATTWLDVSSLYGSTPEVADKLRAHEGGLLKTQQAYSRGDKRNGEYLPYNSMGVPTRTRPGGDPSKLFAGGDPRTNEDWIMLSVHSLLLREHNRLAGILAAKRPEFDDEDLYQTTRLLMSAKFSLIGNAYQMAYFHNMTWPVDDGFPLYREMSGKDWLQINPANTYPWPIATKNGKPTVVSAEMAVVYRFHEFIISKFPIKGAANETLWEQDVFATGFNATGFIDTGIENILRGVTSTHIPNFKSGVDEAFRSAGRYRGAPFDIVTTSIVHEREQGLPPFNAYFKAYNAAGPKVQVKIRERFEDFSSDPEMVAQLQRLYKTPNDVDLVVGCQLDEDLFPHATIPTSSLIISLFSLISMGNSDRFSIGFAAMRCLLVDKPWDCHPSNALEDLLWKPMPKPGFPNFRFYDPFWMTELDFQAHGQNLLWRLVTENTNIKCLQRNPLFPVDPISNPVLCSLAPTSFRTTLTVSLSTLAEVTLKWRSMYQLQLIGSGIVLLLGWFIYGWLRRKRLNIPKRLYGWPIVGLALNFQKDPKAILLKGLNKLARRPSETFGMHLASLTHYLLNRPEDLQMMLDDNPYEVKFGVSAFYNAINMPIILRQVNFDSDMHTKLIRTHLGDPKTIKGIGSTIEKAASEFLEQNRMIPASQGSKQYNVLVDYMNRYITTVDLHCMLGPEAGDHPELVGMFLKFNATVDQVMGLGMMLPSRLRFLTGFTIDKSYKKFREIFKPIIRRRRQQKQRDGDLTFMTFILEITEDDDRAADLVTLAVWIGLRNLQITVLSTLLDLINVPGLQARIVESLRHASVDNLDTFTPTDSRNPWALLRSSMFESIRLCGPITGPARIVTSRAPVALASDPTVHFPSGAVATLSSYYTHRQHWAYGPDAASFHADRFLSSGSPDIGSPNFITWGLKGPHTCPGRWFAQEAICILIKALLLRYEFQPATFVDRDDDKYEYHAGVVTRKEVPVTVTVRV